MLRLVFSLLIFALGMWLFYTISYTVGYAAAKSAKEWAHVTQDPMFLLRFAGAVLACAGGAMCFAKGATGPMVAGLAAVASGIVAVALLLNGGSETVYMRDIINTVALLALAAGCFVFDKDTSSL